MDTNGTYVIVGASLAGAKAAQALRSEGFGGSVVLIGAEREAPYERPPLSKDFLMGKTSRDALHVHPADWYGEQEIELRLGTAVTRIDAAGHQVTLADGQSLGYARLLLATGAVPRSLGLPGAEQRGVIYLRTVDDSERMRAAFAGTPRVAVIGAGWIGLEAAAAAREAGCEVTVVEMAELPLLAVLGPEVARVFADLHLSRGVEFVFGARVSEITGSGGSADGVLLADGTRVAADVVVVGVGARPYTDLAESAGLRVENGVITDAALRTSDPDIFAAGDVANAFHPFYGRHVRVEHWANALHQPEVAARSMLGREASYDRLPYFFTDQYDLGMEYTGLVEPGGYDRVVFRGDVPGREFVAFWLDSEDRVLAGMNVNVWGVVDIVTELIRARQAVPPSALADVAVPLDSLAAG